MCIIEILHSVGSEAGLSNGAIYYNFESKGDPFFALLEQRQEDRIRHMRRTLGSDAAAGGRDRALDQEARDATRSLKDNREWRLLLLEFTAHAARTPALATKLRAQKRRLRDTLAELLGRRLADHAAAPNLSADQLALAATALASGLAVEEISDPGSVPDELFGDLLATLIAPTTTAAQ